MRGFKGIAIILTKNNTWARVWTLLGLWVGELFWCILVNYFFHKCPLLEICSLLIIFQNLH
jgi:hypothetical protein